MEMFPSVRNAIVTMMNIMKLEGYWIQSSWEHIPFAIVVNEEKILEATKRRFPGNRFNSLDILFDTIEIYNWGYYEDFSQCSCCKRVISLNPDDNDFVLDPESNQNLCINCCNQKKT